MKFISRLTYTPVTNIANNAVVNNGLVKTCFYDTDNDTFKMKAVIDGVNCKPISMLTKSESLWAEDVIKFPAIGATTKGTAA